MDFKTGISTLKGENIHFGDILTAPQMADVVVLRDYDGSPIVQVIEKEDFVFPLKSFVYKWPALKVEGSILTRDRSKLTN